MLRIGRMRARSCQGMNRRAFLEVGSIGVLGVSLPLLLRSRASAQTEGAARSKSVILLWLWGGPPHMDTFDMKPDAPAEYRGPYRPIATNVPGIEICELLPRLARHADKYAIIRSMLTDSDDHGIGGTLGLTGSDSGALSLGGERRPGRVNPTHGSVVARVRGTGASSGAAIPPFVTLGGFLHQGHRPIEGDGAGWLGGLYDPFRLDYDPMEGVKIPQLDLMEGLTVEGLHERRQLLESLDRARRQIDESPAVQQLDQFYQQAFSLLTSGEARRVFNLDEEDDATRTRYGRFRFGQCCLLARRLVEAGVSFVQVNWSSHVEPIEDAGDGGWDMHDRNFPQLQDRHSWMLDQAMSALLEDLAARGLLSETVVLALGEFGRTPRINGKAGRDHWPQAYCALVGGGGLRGGQVIGASDRLGEHPAVRPLRPRDVARTVLSQIGIGTTNLTEVGIEPMGEVIEELV